MNFKLGFTLFLIILIIPYILFAQQDIPISGLVVEQNSKINSGIINLIANVSVTSPGATPTISSIKGNFTLVFNSKPIGNLATVYAEKNGYEVVNHKELENTSIVGRQTPLKIVMCQEGQLYKNQIEYYNIANQIIRQQYELKITQLNSDIETQTITLPQLSRKYNKEIQSTEEAIEVLYSEYQTLSTSLEELSLKFATINLDDQSEDYAQAFEFLKNGNILLAIETLDSIQIEKRIAFNINQLGKEKSISDKVYSSLEGRIKEIQQDINQVILKAQLHQLVYEFDKAEECYLLALKYDSTNVDLIRDIANFYYQQNSFC